MKKQWVRLNPTLLAASIAGIASLASSAQAQETAASAGSAGIPEVIVTAQRTAAPESRTPVAMSVLTAGQLDQAGIDNAGAIGDRFQGEFLSYEVPTYFGMLCAAYAPKG